MIRRAILILLLVASPLLGSSEVERLTALCRVWATAKYLNPAVAFGDVDWDAALVRAIPKVRAASTDEELAQAIGSMLHGLNDPATQVVEQRIEQKPADTPLFRWDGDVLIVSAGPYAANHTIMGLWIASRELTKELQKAKKAIFDVRFHPDDPDNAEFLPDFIFQLDGLSTDTLMTPRRQYVFHSGFRQQESGTSPAYFSGLLVLPGEMIQASRQGAPTKIAFVTDAHSRLPKAVVALRDAGKAFIVSAEPLDESVIADTKNVAIAGSWHCHIRVATSGPLNADVVATDPMAEALAILRGQKTAPQPPPTRPSAPTAMIADWKPDPAYADMTYPDVEHRILAAFRIWSVIDYFYPYKALIEDWQPVLPELLPRFIDARNADEYATAVLEMVARVEDGHSRATGHPSLNKILGEVAPPILVRLVENEFVVTKINYDMPKDLPLHVGDIVVSVDGEPFRARVDRLRPLLTASTERARVNRIAPAALRGSNGSEAVLQVKGPDGITRTVNVPRGSFASKPSGAPPYRVLSDNIGYVDMMELKPDQVDAMFEALANTKAIIFDIRGYPNGTAWAIAPRINVRNAKIGAIFRRVQVSGINNPEESASRFYFEQPLPRSDKPKYHGKTVALIDDRAVSHAEHTCLFFEAANGTTFVGSPTAGANGDVTSFRVPGGFRVFFTGHDVRHADGRQLQRVGIKPDVEIEPTIKGLREGRDEVLERAIKYLNEVK